MEGIYGEIPEGMEFFQSSRLAYQFYDFSKPIVSFNPDVSCQFVVRTTEAVGIIRVDAHCL